MKGKKNASVGHLDIDAEILEEFFPRPNSAILDGFDEPSCLAIGRLITATAGVGGMVTFYYSDDNNCIGLTVRAGQRKRSLLLGGDDIDATFIESLANGMERIWVAKKQLEKATELAEEASKGKKKGK